MSVDFSDDFNRANGPAGNGWVPWSPSGGAGDPYIYSNRLSGDGLHYAAGRRPESGTDFKWTVSAIFAGVSGWSRVCGASLNSGYAFGISGGKFYALRYDAGVQTALGSQTQTTVYPVGLKLVGTSIRCIRSGADSLPSVVDATHASGYTFACNSGTPSTTAYVDGLVVTDLVPAGGTTTPVSVVVTGTGVVGVVRGVGLAHAVTGGYAASVVRGIRLRHSASGTGAATFARKAGLHASASGAGVVSVLRGVHLALAALGEGVAGFARRVRLNVAASGGSGVTVAFGRFYRMVVAVTGGSSAGVGRGVKKKVCARGVGSGRVVRKVGKTLSVVGLGVATMLKGIPFHLHKTVGLLRLGGDRGGTLNDNGRKAGVSDSGREVDVE